MVASIDYAVHNRQAGGVAREAEDFQDTCARAADAAGLAIVHGVIYARDHVNGAASANGKH